MLKRKYSDQDWANIISIIWNMSDIQTLEAGMIRKNRTLITKIITIVSSSPYAPRDKISMLQFKNKYQNGFIHIKI